MGGGKFDKIIITMWLSLRGVAVGQVGNSSYSSYWVQHTALSGKLGHGSSLEDHYYLLGRNSGELLLTSLRSWSKIIETRSTSPWLSNYQLLEMIETSLLDKDITTAVTENNWLLLLKLSIVELTLAVPDLDGISLTTECCYLISLHCKEGYPQP